MEPTHLAVSGQRAYHSAILALLNDKRNLARAVRELHPRLRFRSNIVKQKFERVRAIWIDFYNFWQRCIHDITYLWTEVEREL